MNQINVDDEKKGMQVSTEKSMLTCILNAAEGQLDIVLSLSGTHAGQESPSILSAQSFCATNKGAEILTPALQSLCEIHKLTPADIGRFACVHGPGSFTGIRLILSTVAAIRRITGAHAAGIDYMQALAHTLSLQAFALQSHEVPVQNNKHICVLTHARRNLVHYQHFVVKLLEKESQLSVGLMQANALSLPLPLPSGDVELVSPMEAANRLCLLAEDELPIYVLGSGLIKNFQTVQKHCHEEKLPGANAIHFVSLQHPSYEALTQLAAAANYGEKDLEPLYIRPCDAVENLPHIAGKQGITAEVANARLQELLNKGLVIQQ